MSSNGRPGGTVIQIGLIASPKQTSGSDRYYFDLVRALRDDGMRIEGVVLGDPTSVPDAIPEIVGFAPEGSRAVRRWSSLRRTVAPLVPDARLVVSHFAPHVFPVLDVVRRLPLVEHFHGPWALEARFAGKPRRTVLLRTLQERAVYRRARRIVALSKAYADILERDYGVSPERIRIVPGGVRIDRMGTTMSKAEARERAGLPGDRPIVVTARRLESTKGVDRLVAAMTAVRAAVPDVLLVIAGTGSMLPDLERSVRDGDLERNVHFAGLVSGEPLTALYASADVSIVPSVAFEGFGLVCIESFACGTPVLVTPVGGLPEAVEGLDRSLILAGSAAGDIAAGLRDALLGTVRLPDADACRAYARGFAWPEIARRIRAVYDEVL